MPTYHHKLDGRCINSTAEQRMGSKEPFDLGYFVRAYRLTLTDEPGVIEDDILTQRVVTAVKAVVDPDGKWIERDGGFATGRVVRVTVTRAIRRTPVLPEFEVYERREDRALELGKHITDRK